MSWKSFLPTFGEKSVRDRIKEIENIAVSFPVFLATSVSKSFESFLVGSPHFWEWLGASVVISVVYVYWDVLAKAERKVEDAVEK
jgi:hypothetical protein